MLASLLPGFRQLRSPLAAGYVLMLAIAIVAAAVGVTPTRIVDGYRAASGLVGAAVAAALVSFAAYVVGILWQATWSIAASSGTRAIARCGHRPLTGRCRRVPFAAVTGELGDTVDHLTRERLRAEVDVGDGRRSATAADFWTAHQLLMGRTAISKEDAVETLLTAGATALRCAAASDLVELVPVRLVGAEKDAWMSWDQVRAETEFRAVLAVPLGSLFVASAFALHPVYAVGVAMTPVLLLTARQKGAEATRSLVELVRAGRVDLLRGSAMPRLTWHVPGQADDLATVRAEIVDGPRLKRTAATSVPPALIRSA